MNKNMIDVFIMIESQIKFFINLNLIHSLSLKTGILMEFFIFFFCLCSLRWRQRRRRVLPAATVTLAAR